MEKRKTDGGKVRDGKKKGMEKVKETEKRGEVKRVT